MHCAKRFTSFIIVISRPSLATTAGSDSSSPKFPSGVGRLSEDLHFSEPDVILGREEKKCLQGRLWAQPRPRRRHRSWPEALKGEIVAAAYAPGSSVSMVVRHYDVANQVFSWRKLYRVGPGAATLSSVPQLVPVVV